MMKRSGGSRVIVAPKVSETTRVAAQEHQRFLRPRAEGLMVRDPVTKAVLPPGGALKPWVGPEGRYWRRRLSCGDVVVGEAEPPEVIERDDEGEG